MENVHGPPDHPRHPRHSVCIQAYRGDIAKHQRELACLRLGVLVDACWLYCETEGHRPLKQVAAGWVLVLLLDLCHEGEVAYPYVGFVIKLTFCRVFKLLPVVLLDL